MSEKTFNPNVYYEFEIWLSSQPNQIYNSAETMQTLVRLAYLSDFFRKVKGIHVEIYSNHSGWGWILTKLNGTTIKDIDDYNFFDDNDTALSKGLIEASYLKSYV